MNFFKRQEQIKKQILSSYNNVAPAINREDRLSTSEKAVFEDMIQKGEISDTLASGYGAGSQPMIFKKTGKEIKEKVPLIVSTLEAQKVLIEAQLNDLQQKVGTVPDQPNSRRYSKNVPFLRYSWNVCNGGLVNKGIDSISTQSPQVDDKASACDKYNCLLYVYNDILDDIDAINIIGKEVEDTKYYSLSVSQLIALNLS